MTKDVKIILQIVSVIEYFYYILVISVRPFISTSTGLIFMKFAGFVELWP